jgi:CRISPR-associated protein Cmr3
MEQTRYFIEPLDVLFFRGNKLFGDPGSFGESLVPPWPSVVAGALRSALLVNKGYDLARFARGEVVDDLELGTPDKPGSFVLTDFTLARRLEDGTVEPLFALPADLVASRRDDGDLQIRRLTPHRAAEGILSSSSTECLAVLPEKEPAKPMPGLWLTADGWSSHLQGRPIEPDKHLLHSSKLWGLDTRVGVGLDPARRRGKLFTVQSVALRRMEHPNPDGGSSFDVGFIAAVAGAELPERLTLRLGGDGRAALAQRTKPTLFETDFDNIAQARRCRLILTSPGLFEGGWRPTGITGEGRNLRLNLQDVKARFVCAAVPRAEVISGFDLAAWEPKPKPAQRVAAAGSVYWLEDLHATAAALRKLAENGLWPILSENTSRRAEGFNRCALAAY